MEQEILDRLKAQEAKIDSIYKTVRQMRQYFLWTFILTIVFFILPLIILAFVLPAYWNILTSSSLL